MQFHELDDDKEWEENKTQFSGAKNIETTIKTEEWYFKCMIEEVTCVRIAKSTKVKESKGDLSV